MPLPNFDTLVEIDPQTGQPIRQNPVRNPVPIPPQPQLAEPPQYEPEPQYPPQSPLSPERRGEGVLPAPLYWANLIARGETTKPAIELPTAPMPSEKPVGKLEKLLVGTNPLALGLEAAFGKDVSAATMRELYNQAKGLPEFMSSPLGLLTLGTGMAAPGPTALAFVGDMVKNVYQMSGQMGENWDRMAPDQKAQSIVQVLGATGLAAGLAHGAHARIGAKAAWQQLRQQSAALPPTALGLPRLGAAIASFGKDPGLLKQYRKPNAPGIPPLIPAPVPPSQREQPEIEQPRIDQPLVGPQVPDITGPITKGAPDARSIEKATEVYGDLRTRTGEGAGQVPAEEGRPGIQPQAERGLPEADTRAEAGQERLLLKPGYAEARETPPPENETIKQFRTEFGLNETEARELFSTVIPAASGRHWLLDRKKADAILLKALKRAGIDVSKSPPVFDFEEGVFSHEGSIIEALEEAHERAYMILNKEGHGGYAEAKEPQRPSDENVQKVYYALKDGLQHIDNIAKAIGLSREQAEAALSALEDSGDAVGYLSQVKNEPYYKLAGGERTVPSKQPSYRDIVQRLKQQSVPLDYALYLAKQEEDETFSRILRNAGAKDTTGADWKKMPIPGVEGAHVNINMRAAWEDAYAQIVHPRQLAPDAYAPQHPALIRGPVKAERPEGGFAEAKEPQHLSVDEILAKQRQHYSRWHKAAKKVYDGLESGVQDRKFWDAWDQLQQLGKPPRVPSRETAEAEINNLEGAAEWDAKLLAQAMDVTDLRRRFGDVLDRLAGFVRIADSGTRNFKNANAILLRIVDAAKEQKIPERYIYQGLKNRLSRLYTPEQVDEYLNTFFDKDQHPKLIRSILGTPVARPAEAPKPTAPAGEPPKGAQGTPGAPGSEPAGPEAISKSTRLPHEFPEEPVYLKGISYNKGGIPLEDWSLDDLILSAKWRAGRIQAHKNRGEPLPEQQTGQNWERDLQVLKEEIARRKAVEDWERKFHVKLPKKRPEDKAFKPEWLRRLEERDRLERLEREQNPRLKGFDKFEAEQQRQEDLRAAGMTEEGMEDAYWERVANRPAYLKLLDKIRSMRERGEPVPQDMMRHLLLARKGVLGRSETYGGRLKAIEMFLEDKDARKLSDQDLRSVLYDLSKEIAAAGRAKKALAPYYKTLYDQYVAEQARREKVDPYPPTELSHLSDTALWRKYQRARRDESGKLMVRQSDTANRLQDEIELRRQYIDPHEPWMGASSLNAWTKEQLGKRQLFLSHKVSNAEIREGYIDPRWTHQLRLIAREFKRREDLQRAAEAWTQKAARQSASAKGKGKGGSAKMREELGPMPEAPEVDPSERVQAWLRQEHNIQPGSQVRVADFPKADWAGRIYYSEAGKPTAIYINAAKIEDRGKLARVVEHESAHWYAFANRDTVDQITQHLNAAEKAEIRTAVQNLRYNPDQWYNEATAMSVQRLAAEWRERPWFVQLVSYVTEWASRTFGFTPTRIMAERMAVRALAQAGREIRGPRQDLTAKGAGELKAESKAEQDPFGEQRGKENFLKFMRERRPAGRDRLRNEVVRIRKYLDAEQAKGKDIHSPEYEPVWRELKDYYARIHDIEQRGFAEAREPAPEDPLRKMSDEELKDHLQTLFNRAQRGEERGTGDEVLWDDLDKAQAEFERRRQAAGKPVPPKSPEEMHKAIEGAMKEVVADLKKEGWTFDPDWGPLELVLNEKWLDGFMFMGKHPIDAAHPNKILHQYKHGITRRYLILDNEGIAYRYDPKGNTYHPIPLEQAVDRAFEGIERMGETRESKYNREYIERRNKALMEAGFTVSRATPEGTLTSVPKERINPDWEDYQTNQRQMREMMQRGEHDTQAFRDLWQRNEDLKNRYGGKPPPKEFGKGGYAEAKESSRRDLKGGFSEARFGVQMRQTARKLNNYRLALRDFWRSRKERRTMTQLMDATDTMANTVARQAGNRLRLAGNPLERRAAMALVESWGDPLILQRFLRDSRTGKNEEAIEAVRYAMANLGDVRLNELADKMRDLLDTQIQDERIAGIDVKYREAYVPHSYNQDLLMGINRPFVLRAGTTGGIATGFKKERAFPDIFEAIAKGYTPQTLDVADLTEHRIRVGQKLINRIEWSYMLGRMRDPATQDPIVKPRGNVTPPGYTPFEIVPGVRISVHERYAPLFDALTGTGKMRSTLPGFIASEVEGALKHGLLLFDTFHVSRIQQKQLFLTGRAGVLERKVTSLKHALPQLGAYGKGLSLLEYADRDLAEAVRQDLITQDMADYARANRDSAELLMRAGFNVGRIQENMYAGVVRSMEKLPKWVPLYYLGAFNKWVFEKMTRGAMLQTGIIELERVSNNFGITKREAAAKVAHDLNVYFGNLGRQGLFKSRDAQDTALLFALAPQWVESMIRTEAGAVVHGISDPIRYKKLAMSSVPLGVISGLGWYTAVTQMANAYWRQKPTILNPEPGHEADVLIPDPTGKSGGWWLSLFSVPAEISHDMIRYINTEPTVLKAVGRILNNKASPIVRGVATALTGVTWDRQKTITSWGAIKEGIKESAPIPIGFQAPLMGSKYPGQAIRQTAASLGIKMEPAESAETLIARMKKDWARKSKDPKIRHIAEQWARSDFARSDYRDLRRLLLQGKMKEAGEEFQRLKDEYGKEEGRITREMAPATGGLNRDRWTPEQPKVIGGQMGREVEGRFYQSLRPEHQAIYRRAMEDDMKVWRNYQALLDAQSAAK